MHAKIDLKVDKMQGACNHLKYDAVLQPWKYSVSHVGLLQCQKLSDCIYISLTDCSSKLYVNTDLGIKLFMQH